jgi:(E)-4-hydroxy-3-methylbut-2-enyl-diphosphate synthase
VGIAGGKGVGLLFKHGEIVTKLSEAELADVLVGEVEQLVNEKKSGARSQKPEASR